MEPVLAIAEQPIQFELVDLELPGIEGVAASTSTEASTSTSTSTSSSVAVASATPSIVSAETARTAAILRGLSQEHSGSSPTGPPPSDAPLVVTSEQPAAPTFVQHFVLRFVGCVQVGAERGLLILMLMLFTRIGMQHSCLLYSSKQSGLLYILQYSSVQ